MHSCVQIMNADKAVGIDFSNTKVTAPSNLFILQSSVVGIGDIQY